MTIRRTLAAALMLAALMAAANVQRANAVDVAPTDAGAAYAARLRLASAQLLMDANKVEHAGKKARLTLTAVHLPPAPLGDKPRFSPSLDDWLQSNLNTIAKVRDKQRHAAELRSLARSLDQAASFQPAPRIETADPHRLAAQILAQRGYDVTGAGPAPPPHPSLWQRIVAWFGRLIGQIFGRLFQGAASVPFIGQVLALALLLGLLTAILYALVTLLRLRTGRDRGPLSLGEPIGAALDPQALYERAVACATAGRYAEAIALLFQASLACFDRVGAIAYDPSRTAGEYRRLVRRRANVASSHFDALAASFTSVAYAEQRPSDEDWSAARSAFLSLQPLVAA